MRQREGEERERERGREEKGKKVNAIPEESIFFLQSDNKVK